MRVHLAARSGHEVRKAPTTPVSPYNVVDEGRCTKQPSTWYSLNPLS